MLSLEYWYLLPTSIVIATIAMASGIGGAVFFSPLFILILKLEPSVAIGTALTTELFGFSSGLFAYVRRKLVDFRLGANLLIFSLPAAVIGSMSADAFPADVLKGIFAAGIIFIGSQLYLSYRQKEKEKLDGEIAQESEESSESVLVDRTGKVYRYTICHKDQGRMFAAVGGAVAIPRPAPTFSISRTRVAAISSTLRTTISRTRHGLQEIYHPPRHRLLSGVCTTVSLDSAARPSLGSDR